MEYQNAVEKATKFWNDFRVWLNHSNNRDMIYKNTVKYLKSKYKSKTSLLNKILNKFRNKEIEYIVDTFTFFRFREFGIVSEAPITREDVAILYEIVGSTDKKKSVKKGTLPTSVPSAAQVLSEKKVKEVFWPLMFIFDDQKLCSVNTTDSTQESRNTAIKHIKDFCSYFLSYEDKIWLDVKLEEALNIIPASLLCTGSYEKFLQVFIGTIMYGLDAYYSESKSPSTRENQEDLQRKMSKVMKIGYEFGLTYPLVDDTIDSDCILSKQEKQDLMEIIIFGLTNGFINEICKEKMPNHVLKIGNAIKERFNAMLALFPFQENKPIYDSLLVLAISQKQDNLRNNQILENDEEIMIPVIIKSAYTRMVVSRISGWEKSSNKEKNLEHSIYTSVFSQLSDDLVDVFSDIENNTFTIFTNYIKIINRIKKEHSQQVGSNNLMNPITDIYFSLPFFLASFYKSPKLQTLLLDRIILWFQELANMYGIDGLKTFFNLMNIKLDNKIAKWIIKLCELELRPQNKGILPSFYKSSFKEFAEIYTPTIIKSITIHSYSNNILIDSMNYSLKAEGKRLRPLLILLTGLEFGFSPKDIMPCAVAVEYLHTSSLILDDLPAQDNADTRRNKSTNHKQFPEYVSQLASVSLISNAYEKATELAKKNIFAKEDVFEVISYMSKIIGHNGISFGQVLDLTAAKKSNENKEEKKEEDKVCELYKIADFKTGLALDACMICPAILAKASQTMKDNISLFAKYLGRIYQIRDDILDSTVNIGKDVGIDIKNGTKTFVTVFGIDQANILLNENVTKAKEYLKLVQFKSPCYDEIITYFSKREK